LTFNSLVLRLNAALAGLGLAYQKYENGMKWVRPDRQITYPNFSHTADGLSLTKSFVQVKSARLRRAIVHLVERIAGDDN
jgi:hypothetical protein